MKKLISLLAGLLLIGMSCIPAFGAVILDTWTLADGLSNGYWNEIFGTNNPGAGGNSLNANAVSGGQWTLWGLSQTASPISGSEYTYETPYSGTFNLATDDIRWGDGFTGLSYNAMNYSDGGTWGDDLKFKFVLVAYNDNYRYDLEAMFDSDGATSYTQLYGDAIYIQHSGGPFDSLTLSKTMVPIPGAVWLLGSGLIGIAGFRRKFKK